MIKPSILNKLKADKRNKLSVKEVNRFYVKVPDLEAHTQHPHGEICGIGHSVHPTIIEKIHELVGAGEIQYHRY